MYKVSRVKQKTDPYIRTDPYSVKLLLFRPGLALCLNFNNRFNLRGCGGALFEFVHVAGGVQQMLLAGVKRMAIAANFRVKLLNS